MTFSFRILVIILSTSAVVAEKIGDWKSSCSSWVDCDSTRNLGCNLTSSQCECAIHSVAELKFVYDSHAKSCVPITADHEREYWTCDSEFYGVTNSKDGLGFCKSELECQTAHKSTSLLCNFDLCWCECLLVHPVTGAALVSSNRTCVYESPISITPVKQIATVPESTTSTAITESRRSSDDQRQRGYYKASCSLLNPCNATRNLTCHPTERQCLCIERSGSGYVYKFDVATRSCVPIPDEPDSQDRFWECEDVIRVLESGPSTQGFRPDSGLGLCKSNHECHIAHNSHNLRCNLDRCSCECLPQHPETGLRLQNVSHACVYEPIECQDDADCVDEYGNHSWCTNTTVCECLLGAHFLQGKCARERKYKESCDNDLECERGAGPNATCSSKHKIMICDCAEGFRFDSGTSLCMAHLHSTVVKPSDADNRCYKAPLIVLMIVCGVCLAALFTLCYLRQGKLRKYSFRRIGTGNANRALELTS